MFLAPVCRSVRPKNFSQAFWLPNYRIRLSGLGLHCLRAYATYTDDLPRIAQPSIWHSIIPKSFRNKDKSTILATPQRSKDWNPATFFICIFLLIGSNAIQMITLKNEYSNFTRKADAKIALLKDVLDRIHRGEHVDVERVLGTGDEEQEQEWADVIKNIEEEDRLWQAKVRRREKRRLKNVEQAATSASDDENTTEADGLSNSENQGVAPTQAGKPPIFY